MEQNPDQSEATFHMTFLENGKLPLPLLTELMLENISDPRDFSFSRNSCRLLTFLFIPGLHHPYRVSA